jgi:hypothetical protein
VQLKQPPLRDFIEGTLDAGYKKAVVGIKSFTLVMDKDHWMIQWNNSVDLRYDYDAGKAQIGVKINQLFVDWKQGMNHSTIPGPDASLSFKQRGWEIMNIDAEMLQFTEHTKVNDQQIIGQMHWAGHNEPAGSANAVMINYKPF